MVGTAHGKVMSARHRPRRYILWLRRIARGTATTISIRTEPIPMIRLLPKLGRKSGLASQA